MILYYKISVKSIKTHCYYAMKNCGGDAEKLRSQLRNIVEHYKVKFNNYSGPGPQGLGQEL